MKKLSLVLSLVFLLSAGACAKKEGPMEKAGKNVDNAVEEVKDGVKEGTEEVKAKVDDDPSIHMEVRTDKE